MEEILRTAPQYCKYNNGEVLPNKYIYDNFSITESKLKMLLQTKLFVTAFLLFSILAVVS